MYIFFVEKDKCNLIITRNILRVFFINKTLTFYP